MTVGQMTNSQGQLDNGKLLSKLHTVILRLDKSKTYRPPNVEAATDYLQQVRLVTTADPIRTWLRRNILHSNQHKFLENSI